MTAGDQLSPFERPLFLKSLADHPQNRHFTLSPFNSLPPCFGESNVLDIAIWYMFACCHDIYLLSWWVLLLRLLVFSYLTGWRTNQGPCFLSVTFSIANVFCR